MKLHVNYYPSLHPRVVKMDEDKAIPTSILEERDLTDCGRDSDPMESRHDKRQWLRKRAKKRYWNTSVVNSYDWHDGNTKACERRAKTKWNTVSRNGNNLWATRGRRGPVAQRAKAQVRRNSRRNLRRYTRSVGREMLIFNAW